VSRDVIVMQARDNVATAVRDLPAGARIQVERNGVTAALTVQEPVAFGHKIALDDLAVGQEVIKYGESIGSTTQAIRRGMHVHVHNLESRRARGDLWDEGMS
jgi:altronate dehydratase small subunit